MSYRLVIDGNSVYEIDEDFERYRETGWEAEMETIQEA